MINFPEAGFYYIAKDFLTGIHNVCSIAMKTFKNWNIIRW